MLVGVKAAKDKTPQKEVSDLLRSSGCASSKVRSRGVPKGQKVVSSWGFLLTLPIYPVVLKHYGTTGDAG